MGREVELKLEVPASAIGDAARLPWLSEGSAGPLKCEKMVTVYFDTAKSKLRQHGLVLRIRSAGESRLQTIKTDQKGAGGAFGRDECEAEIDCDTPNLKLEGHGAGASGHEKTAAKAETNFRDGG